MDNPESALQEEIRSFCEGTLSLDQTRNLAARIGDMKYVAGAPVLLQLLQHKDEIVRYHAIMSLGFNLRFKDGTSALVQVLKGDPDEDCRDAAAGALGALWRNTKDRQIIEDLANAALEDSDEDVQKAAYSSLIAVNGVSDEEYLEMLRQERKPVDPRRVDSIVTGKGADPGAAVAK